MALVFSHFYASYAVRGVGEATAKRFQRDVEASMVGWNVSSRFNDGNQLGLGAEMIRRNTQNYECPLWVISGPLSQY